MKIFRMLFEAYMMFAMPVFLIPEAHDIQYFAEPEDPVKIGYLISDNQCLAARHGAELAILKANEKGGFNGRPFELGTRSMEGPWGTGSKQAVSLIFEEKVWALMGSNDGRNGHIIEQAAVKTHIAFVSVWAGDPTLSQAFVPWYFSCVPNDNQKADALINEVYSKRKFKRTAIISDDTYDSKTALSSFVKKAKSRGLTDIFPFYYNERREDFSAILDSVIKADVNCLILFGHPSSSMKLINQMHRKNIEKPVFGSLYLLDEKELSDKDLGNYESVVIVTPGHWLNPEASSFINEFQTRYGYVPGAVAAYAFDGMNVIIEAVRTAGLDFEKIKLTLADIKYKGVTGLIQFDSKGNRLGDVRLMEIKDGYPSALER